MVAVAFTPNTAISYGLTTTLGTYTVGGSGHFIRCANGGSGNAYIIFFEVGTTPPAITATNSLMLPPGAIEIFSVTSDTTQIREVGDATGTTLNLVRGEGM